MAQLGRADSWSWVFGQEEKNGEEGGGGAGGKKSPREQEERPAQQKFARKHLNERASGDRGREKFYCEENIKFSFPLLFLRAILWERRDTPSSHSTGDDGDIPPFTTYHHQQQDTLLP